MRELEHMTGNSIYTNFLEPGEEHHLDRRFGLGPESFKSIMLRISNSYLSLAPGAIAEIGAGACHHIIDSANIFHSSRHMAFEPSPDMFAQGKVNVAKSGLKNVETIQLSMEDMPSCYKSFFDVTISCMVMHFTQGIDSYLEKLNTIAAPGSMHLIVDAVLPDVLPNSLNLAIEDLFKLTFSFKVNPIKLGCLKEKFEANNFQIIEGPSEVVRISEHDASKYIESMPSDQSDILHEISRKYNLSATELFGYDFLNIFLLRRQ